MATANSNTQQAKATLEPALSGIPANFRNRILESYIELRQAYDEGNFDAASLRGGKFCESVLRFLQQHLTGNHIAFSTKIGNLTDECRLLERLPRTAGPENLRIIMPRALDFAYTIRNKRGVGHVAGDVEANQIDAATVVRAADWCLCELMRFFHALPLEEAQALLDAISVRQLPKVWSVAGKKRVLQNKLDTKSQTLLLLHSELQAGVLTEDLSSWVEYGRVADFKRRVLVPLHKERLIELDIETDVAIISPKGAKRVEEEILPKLHN